MEVTNGNFYKYNRSVLVSNLSKEQNSELPAFANATKLLTLVKIGPAVKSSKRTSQDAMT